MPGDCRSSVIVDRAHNLRPFIESFYSFKDRKIYETFIDISSVVVTSRQ